MRHLFSSFAALGLVGLVVGCHHTAGMCDCDQPDSPCCYYNTGASPQMVAPAAPAMGGKMMPQEKEKITPPTEKKDKEL